jgi:nicotinamidase-related amidase
MATPCLLVIDMQQAFVTHAEHWGPGGERNNPGAEERVRELLAAFRSRGMPVVHARHDSVEEGSPLWPGLPSHAFIAGCEPPDDESEPVFGKAVNSAFIGTDLEAHLRANFLSDLVICGITSIHCVNTTVRMAGNLGFSVRVPEDATATFARRNVMRPSEVIPAQVVHETALSVLHGEFCQVTTTAEIIEALGGGSSRGGVFLMV